MTVPVNMVRKDHVYKIIANGCSNIKIPMAIMLQDTISNGPRLSHLGQLDPSAGAAWGEVGGETVDIIFSFSLLFADCAKGNSAQQVLSHQNREYQNRNQEQGGTSSHCGPVLTALADDDWNEGWRCLCGT